MNTMGGGDLKQAYKQEKDGDVKIRILAMLCLYTQNKNIQDTSDALFQSTNLGSTWKERFDKSFQAFVQALEQAGRHTYPTTN